MAYEQHEWVNGETITAAKMNNIEEGIAEAAQSGGGGYDIVVRLSKYTNNSSITDSDISLVSGSYADCMEKVKNGGFITAAIYAFDYYSDTEFYYAFYPVDMVAADLGYHECIELFCLKSGASIPSVGVRNAGGTGSVSIYGATNEYLRLYFTESGISTYAPW